MPTPDITHLSVPSKKKHLRNIYYQEKWSFNVSEDDKSLPDLEYYKKLESFLEEKRKKTETNNASKNSRGNATYIHDKAEYRSIIDKLIEKNGQKIYNGFELGKGASSCDQNHHLVLREKRLSPNMDSRKTRKALLVSEMFDKLFDLFSEYRHDFKTLTVDKVFHKITNDDNGKGFGGYAFVQSWLTEFSQIINKTYSQYHPKVVTIDDYKSKIVPPVMNMQPEIDLCGYWGSYLTEGKLPFIEVMEWIDEMFYNPTSRVIEHSSKTPTKEDVQKLLFPKQNKRLPEEIKVKDFLLKMSKLGLEESISTINGNVCYLYMHLSNRNKLLLIQKNGKDPSTRGFTFLWKHFQNQYLRTKDAYKNKNVVLPKVDAFINYIKKGVLQKKEGDVIELDVLATLIYYTGNGKAQVYHVDMLYPLIQVVIACSQNVPCTVVYEPIPDNGKITCLNHLLKYWEKCHILFGEVGFPDITPVWEELMSHEGDLEMESPNYYLENYSFVNHFPHDLHVVEEFQGTLLDIGGAAVMRGGSGHNGPASTIDRVGLFAELTEDLSFLPYDPDTQTTGVTILPFIMGGRGLFQVLAINTNRFILLKIVGWYALFSYPQSVPTYENVPGTKIFQKYLKDLQKKFNKVFGNKKPDNCFDLFEDQDKKTLTLLAKKAIDAIPEIAKKYCDDEYQNMFAYV